MKVLFFISFFVLVAFAAHSQTPTFTFECFCGTLTPADTTCDICNTSTQSRYFKGLLIRKNGAAFKWIEEPYTVIQNFTALTFKELIPNAEQIRIELSGTEWTTIEGFRDSVQCPCAGGGSVTLVPGPGISIYGDTISVIPQQIDTFDIVGGDTLRISLDRDSVPFHFVIFPPDSDNQNLSYAPSTGIMSISGGTGDTINVMVGATAGTNGERGLVPKPLAGEQGAFLRGDGSWANPSVGGDNWGTQVAQVTARLSGDGTAGLPLDIAQQGATSGQTLKWNGSSWSPANDLDTSGYNLSFSISGDTLYIQDGASTKFVNLLPYKDNTDAQTLSIDSVTTSDGRRFALSISNGNTVYFEDRDNQQIDTFSISGQVVSLSVQRDGQPAKTITLPTADGSETIVTGANGVQVTGNGTSGTPYVVAPPTGSDTQTLRYSGTTLTANSALTNNGAQIGINIAPDASYRLKVKQSTDTDGIAVVRSSSTSQIGLYHNTNGILKTNSNNMFFESAGVIALYPAGGGFISQVSINSQSPITVASGNSGLLRLDATYAPTAAGGDFGFLKIYPDINQTSAADQPLFGVDINPNLISLRGQLYGVRYWPSVGRYLFQPNGDTVSSHFRGRLGIGSGTTDPVRRLHVVGDMRLTGSIDTPTAVMGRDGDGDVANLALSGMSVISGTLTATDPSATNEIQRLDTFEIVGNTLRASLLNDAVPFSSVSLAPYLDNTDDQVVDTFTIVSNTLRLSLESDGQPFKSVDLSPYVNIGTDLSYSGASSPVSLNSSTGNDVTVAGGTGISLSATSGNLTVTNTDPDQSTTNELQTLANTSNSTTHTATLSNSGGSVQIAEGAGIGLATTGTTLDGVVTITATDTSATNEIQTLSATGAGPTSYDIELSLSGGAVTLTEGAGINLTRSSNTITVASTIVDTDAQNLTIEGSGPTYDIAISGGTDVTIAGAGILTLSESPANTLIFTATEADGNAANEGILGVGAGGANTATLLSNTTGQTPVTVSGATGIGVSESTSGNGGTITVSPANDLAALEALASTGIAVRTASETWEQRTITAGTGISVADGNGVSGNPTITNTGDLSSTNEAWTIDADDADTELITTQTVKFQGDGITVTDYVPGTDILTITSTEVDGSTSNELQTLNNTGDATSHTATLSNSGGSLKLKEGTNVTITTDVTGLNGEVTISATGSADGNGIYGDGVTPGSGSDNLPPGGSTVTIPGPWQPLNFAINSTPSGAVITALQVSVDTCDDTRRSRYLVGKSPSDSLEIYNFDCGAVIKETGGILEMTTDREMYLSADSVNIATVPARTIGAAMLAMNGSGFVRKISGSSVGHILKWDGTNWVLGTDNTGSGTLDGAENGLSVSSNKVRLGGTLITTTSINNAGFDLRTYGGKASHQQYTGFGYTPTQSFGVSGHEGAPTTGGSPTQDGIAEFVATSSGGSDQPNSLTIGAMTTDNNGMWIQARARAVPNFYYPLLFQPNGGRAAIGRSATTAAHFTVTASGLTGSTASGMVGLFENSGGSGNVSVGFGAGSDAVSGQLMWNGTTDAMRIVNRNATNGTSSVRVAVGGETSDVATFEKSAATSLVQFGVGTTAPHSTIQSAGSIATAYLETVGAPTFDETKRTVVYTANTNTTWTIPTAASCACQGREYILHHSGTAGTVTLSQSVSKGNGGNFTTLAAGEWAYIIYGSSSIRGYKLASL